MIQFQVRKIQSNFYINYGDTKNLFDFIFANFYAENTARFREKNNFQL